MINIRIYVRNNYANTIHTDSRIFMRLVLVCLRVIYACMRVINVHLLYVHRVMGTLADVAEIADDG